MYIIRKSSRSGNTPYSCGLTCEEAGVPCEHIYKDKIKAISDAEKLSKVNPIGFDVVRVVKKKGKPHYKLPFRFTVLHLVTCNRFHINEIVDTNKLDNCEVTQKCKATPCSETET